MTYSIYINCQESDYSISIQVVDNLSTVFNETVNLNQLKNQQDFPNKFKKSMILLVCSFSGFLDEYRPPTDLLSEYRPPSYCLNDEYFNIIINQNKYQLSEFLKTKPNLDHQIIDDKLCSTDINSWISLFDSSTVGSTVDYLFQMMVNAYNPKFLSENSQIGLLLQIDDENICEMYNFDSSGQFSSGDNCGINLLLPSDIDVPPNARSFEINYLVKAEANPKFGYLLLPRSSIAKTNNDTLRQSNSIGLIEPSYRGYLIAKVDNLSEETKSKKKKESISQLVMPNLRTNWTIQKVLRLSSTLRGTGGFGSTGK